MCVSGVAVVGGFNVWCSCVSVTGAIVTTGGRGGYGSFFFLGCCGCCVSVFKFQEVGQKRHSYQLCMYVPKLQAKIYINLYQCAVVECVWVLSGCWSHVVRTIFQQQQQKREKKTYRLRKSRSINYANNSTRHTDVEDTRDCWLGNKSNGWWQFW